MFLGPIRQRSPGRLWTVSEFRYIRENCRASTLTSKFYFWLGEFLRTGKEEESWSDNQEEEHVDGPGEVEHCDTKKCSRRRYSVVTELQKSWYGERNDDEGICKRMTDDLMICEPLSQSKGDVVTAYRSIPNATCRCEYSTL